MKTIFVTTRNNNDSVLLSINPNGLQCISNIFLNGNVIKTVEGPFNNYYLGTNLGLKGNRIMVSSHVANYPAGQNESNVTCLIDGIADTESPDTNPSNPATSTKEFGTNPYVDHFVSYVFL
jgi:hypothetical protein